MTGTRSYGDECGLARALDLIGERWALMILRELLYGPVRFSDIRARLGASPNVLSQRLEEMLQNGLVQHRRTGGAVYALTERAAQLRPAMLALTRWGLETDPGEGETITACAALLALEARYEPGLSGAEARALVLQLGDEAFLLQVHQGGLTIQRQAVPGQGFGAGPGLSCRPADLWLAIASLAGRQRLIDMAQGDGLAVRALLAGLPAPGGANRG